MFFAEPSSGFKPPRVARSMAAALVLAVLGTLYLGIMPARVLDTLENARDQISLKSSSGEVESDNSQFTR
jgi:NADH:ubiquinone oxidoreductase subunit 2 (subunit N)